MGKSISDVGVEDLVGAGLSVEEAKGFQRHLKDSIFKVSRNSDNGEEPFDPKELWRELTAQKLLKPWRHPHALHQLIYYSVYHNYDESTNGPPIYWFPSLYQSKNTNLGRLMETHCPKLLGALYKDPIASFRQFHRFSVEQPEVYWSIVLDHLSIKFLKAPDCILDTSDESKHGGKWFPSSVLNIAECCLVPSSCPKKEDDSLAIIWRNEGCDNLDVSQMTLRELRELVMLVANVLAAKFSKGDAIAIDMPMTATAVIIYLAIVLAGLVVVSIADSFAAQEIATRLRVSKARAVFTQDFILRGGRRVPLYRLFSKPSFLFGILLLMADIENKLIIPITKLCGLAEYTILRKEEGSLYQGKIQRFGKDHGDVSFLLFQSEEEVSNIVKNLEKFTGEEFLVVKDVIKDSTNDCYWLIVEYVTSLTKIQETKAVWSKKRLELPYRQILRDMIIGFHKLHEKKTPHGPISASQIYIGLGGHGKLAHICGNAENWDEQLRSIDVAGLRELFRQILGSNAENEELVHFQKRFLDRQMSNPAVVVEKLFYHPLLMSDVERFYMPLITNTNLRHGTGFPSTADAAQAFDWSFKPLDEDWSKAVPWRGAYRLVYRKGKYGTGVWSRFCYTRNCTQHITDDDITTELQSQGRPTMRGSTGAIARDLSSFFEGHLLYVYDFFSLADFKSC